MSDWVRVALNAELDTGIAMNLMLGDCFERMKEIPDGSVDLTVTSPPYDNLRNYNNSLEWGEHVWKPVLQELFRVTKKGGVVVWIVGDATIKGSETGTSFKQALHAMECGFNLHDTMIWNKPTFTATGALRVRYAQVFEYMFIFSKGKPKSFNPIKDRVNKSFGSKKHSNVRQADGSMKPTTSIGKPIAKNGQRFNVWDMNTELSSKNRFHPAMFPEHLANDHIISWSNEGDVVLDCFMGSGTTGKMALLNNRKFIGIEKDAGYFEIARQRLGV